MRGFRGERWWVWVAMAVLAAGIIILNILTAVLNHVMPRENPSLSSSHNLTCTALHSLSTHTYPR